MPIIHDWSEFKAICIVKKNLSLQYTELGDRYEIIGPDAGGLAWSTTIRKNLDNGSANPDVEDFLTNVEPACNFAIGVRPYAFASGDFEFIPAMVKDICPAGESKSSYYKITENCRINGGKIVTDGKAVFGDWLEVWLVDHDNLFGAGVDFVLKKWVLSWGHDWKACSDTIIVPYAGTPPIGMYFMLTYHSTGAEPVGFMVNYFMHRPI